MALHIAAKKGTLAHTTASANAYDDNERHMCGARLFANLNLGGATLSPCASDLPHVTKIAACDALPLLQHASFESAAFLSIDATKFATTPKSNTTHRWPWWTPYGLGVVLLLALVAGVAVAVVVDNDRGAKAATSDSAAMVGTNGTTTLRAAASTPLLRVPDRGVSITFATVHRTSARDVPPPARSSVPMTVVSFAVLARGSVEDFNVTAHSERLAHYTQMRLEDVSVYVMPGSLNLLVRIRAHDVEVARTLVAALRTVLVAPEPTAAAALGFTVETVRVFPVVLPDTDLDLQRAATSSLGVNASKSTNITTALFALGANHDVISWAERNVLFANFGIATTTRPRQ